MDAGLIDRIETTAERLASALFAAAVGYAVYRCLAAVVYQPAPGLYAGVAAAMAYLVCDRSLKAAAQHNPQLGLPMFHLREINTYFADDELLLTEADRLHGELLLTDADRVPAGAEPLVLDDMIAQLD